MDREAETLCDCLPKAVWHEGAIAEIALHAVRESVATEDLPIISHDVNRIEHAARILNFYATRAQELEELVACLRKRNLESSRHLEKFKRRNAALDKLLSEREQLIKAEQSAKAAANPGSRTERGRAKGSKRQRAIVLPVAAKRVDRQNASGQATKSPARPARRRKADGTAPAIRANKDPLPLSGQALRRDAAEDSIGLIGCRLPT
ncbi:MAG: hypothetical protein NVSMB26_27050 [Beijerinckiaceae bacterium]